MDGLTLNTTYRSPCGPPLTPGEPSPAKRTCCSLSTPSGTVTSSLTVLFSVPFPLHVGHGSSNSCPLPSHLGQTCSVLTLPKIVFCSTETRPAPLQ